MNIFKLFIFLFMNINAIFCLAMETNKDLKPQKILSTLFKLMHKNESSEESFLTKKPKDSYTNHLNNFNQHTTALRNAIEQAQKNPSDTQTIPGLRSTIITEDLIPLRHKVKNILRYIKNNNLYLSHSNQAFSKSKYSPRIQIIDSMIATLKNDTIELDDKTVQNYQYIMNHIADFSTEKNHDNIVESQILAALEIISLNNKDKAKKLAELLHEEIVNENALKKCIKKSSL